MEFILVTMIPIIEKCFAKKLKDFVVKPET